MISFIHGELAEIQEGMIVVEASGVGYGIRVPATVIGALPSIGEEVKIYTYFSVTQNGVELCGFLTSEDREMFTMLLTVSGVGPKGALGILSAMSPDDLRMAIVTGDSKAISRAPGVGSKTAQRIVLDLKDKLDASEVFNTALDHGASGSGSTFTGAAMAHSAQREAVEALVALGYSETEASRAVKKVEINGDMTVDQILKLALKNLSFL
ncbi:MAG: Holliday junction branch migration protein RuvA [Oribacterium sp.]|nr:Holliday junction branch migration protein RuvA [Oribacterium sp.]MBO6308112.1 Holliday junction branch migration protein RuvA [Oribacterium sp.]